MSKKQEKKTLEETSTEVLNFLLKKASTNGFTPVQLFTIVEEKFKKHEKADLYVRSTEWSD